MRRTVLGLLASMTLSLGCVHQAAIPDPTIPHRVAKETAVVIWVRMPNGTLVQKDVRLLEGWWIAGPPVVELEPLP